jgi:hypothetical protein
MKLQQEGLDDIWSFGITVSSAGTIIAVLKLWPNAAPS